MHHPNKAIAGKLVDRELSIANSYVHNVSNLLLSTVLPTPVEARNSYRL